MAGGNLLSRSRIIHILNAVTTEHQAPVGLRLCGKLATMLSYTAAALSNSQAARRRWARAKSVSFFSLSAVGTVCLVPQYSHSATVMPASIFKSPPHILHLIMAILDFPPVFYLIRYFISGLRFSLQISWSRASISRRRLPVNRPRREASSVCKRASLECDLRRR